MNSLTCFSIAVPHIFTNILLGSDHCLTELATVCKDWQDHIYSRDFLNQIVPTFDERHWENILNVKCADVPFRIPLGAFSFLRKRKVMLTYIPHSVFCNFDSKESNKLGLGLESFQQLASDQAVKAGKEIQYSFTERNVDLSRTATSCWVALTRHTDLDMPRGCRPASRRDAIISLTAHSLLSENLYGEFRLSPTPTDPEKESTYTAIGEPGNEIGEPGNDSGIWTTDIYITKETLNNKRLTKFAVDDRFRMYFTHIGAITALFFKENSKEHSANQILREKNSKEHSANQILRERNIKIMEGNERTLSILRVACLVVMAFGNGAGFHWTKGSSFFVIPLAISIIAVAYLIFFASKKD